jgi:polysaccharide pyruvyl transferase WcaK-like protein
MVRAGKQIGLLHHAGGGNLGDDATLDAVICNIRSRWPKATICGFTMNPEDTKSRHGIPAYPIRQRTWSFGHTVLNAGLTSKDRIKAAVFKSPVISRLLKTVHAALVKIPSTIFGEIKFLAGSLGIIRSCDLLIVCGGGQLVESSGGPWTFLGGPWNFPYTIFKWILLARVARVKSIVLNVGAGPLVRPLSKRFVRGALSLADYASFRDEQSRTLAKHTGFNGEAYVFPDSAYSHDIAALDISEMGKRNRPNVGFAPMAYGDPRLSREHDGDSYDRFIQELALFGSHLIENQYSITLFCSDIGVDPPAVEDVQRTLKTHRDTSGMETNGSVRRAEQWNMEELIRNMSSMDYVIACRYHAVIFAHMLNIPVLAISHHPKVETLMGKLGLSEYCVDISRCDAAVLAETFKSVVRDREEIKKRMAETLAANREMLARQFDELFPPEPCSNSKNAGAAVAPILLCIASLIDSGLACDSLLAGCIARISDFC